MESSCPRNLLKDSRTLGTIASRPHPELAEKAENLDDTISLLVVQPTPFCNLDCGYCYLSPESRATKGYLSISDLSKVFTTIFDSSRVGPSLNVCWHAGEPLVLPPDYYRRAFNEIDKLAPAGTKLHHMIQTNGTLITDAWCELFREYNVEVGVSIDGPEHLHNRHRLDRRGRGTFSRVLSGIATLVKNNVPYYTLTVLTESALDQPKLIFEFLLSLGVKEACFNVEECEGANKSTTFSSNAIERRVFNFFKQYYELLRDHNFPHWVRELDYAFNAVLLAKLDRPRNALVTPYRSINVDYMGNFSTFCPELLGVETQAYGRFIFGNLISEPMHQAFTRQPYISVNADIQEGVRRCAESCSYFSLCGGGAPANKLFENGTFVSTETVHCRLKIKTMIDLALQIIESDFQINARLDIRPKEQ